MGLEWIFRMSRRACSLGSSMSEKGPHQSSGYTQGTRQQQVGLLRILRSSLPGRSRAGSRVSGRLVAMIILTLCSVSKPSIWFNSWRHRCPFHQCSLYSSYGEQTARSSASRSSAALGAERAAPGLQWKGC